MIKVNLLRNRGVESGFDTEVLDLTGGSDDQKQNILKILLMLSFSVLLYFYGSWQQDKAKEEYQAVLAQKNNIEAELKKLEKEAQAAQEAQKKILELEKKINVIKDLSKVRLREIKAFDFLQNLIPERVWLSGLKYDDDQANLQGFALSDDALNAFVERLESRAEFTDVILLRSGDATSGSGKVKSFELSMVLVTQE